METPLRILVVADDPFVAADTAENMLRAGYMVCGKAISYETALNAMRQSMPDPVLINITLDGPADRITTARELMRMSHSVVINFAHLNRPKSKWVFIGAHEITIPDGARKTLLNYLEVIKTR